MLPADDDVVELTRLIWETAVGLRAEGRTGADAESFDVRLSVDITGGWEGTVSLSMPGDLARAAAAAMLAVPADAVPPAEVRDAALELANMIGGNVKGILPGPSQLSLPRLEHAAEASEAEGDVRRLWFESGGKSFSVTVIRRSGGST